MADFLSLFSQPENVLFTVSLVIFVGLTAMLLFGLGGDGGDVGGDVGGDIGGDGSIASGYPIMCFFMPFFGIFGILGVISNSFLAQMVNVTVLQQAAISVLVSGLISYQASSMMARFIASALPSVESYGLSTVDLADCIATVVGEKMDSDKLVRISVTDKRDNTYTLLGKLMPGYDEIEHGGIARVVEHDVESDVCFCVPASASITQPSSSDVS